MGIIGLMKRIAACLAVVLATLAAPPARGQASPLEWQYECLKNPNAVCFDATPSGSDPLPAPEPKGAPKAVPSDPLAVIAAHLQARNPRPADIAALQARARAGNARALELLAWAELTGVGAPRDPVQAYFIYGMAAAAGMLNGRRDQVVIFESSLTAEQRQQILIIENGNLAKLPSP
jgi:TPR repeat protein